MQTVNEMRLEVLEAIAEHPQFRQDVLQDPHQAIKDAMGISVPDNFALSVHEDAADLVHVVLPPDPSLDLEQLQEVAGGHWSLQGHTHDSDDYWNGGDNKW